MTGRGRNQVDGLPQKTGPMKATLPISSLMPLSSPIHYQHTSPEHRLIRSGSSAGSGLLVSGGFLFNMRCHRSSSAIVTSKVTFIRRTASLDTLYINPSSQSTIPSLMYTTVLQFDKATQTDESYIGRLKVDINYRAPQPSYSCPIDLYTNISIDKLNDIRFENIIRQRLQKSQNRSSENSVSSQTLSPIHIKANPVLIPSRVSYPSHHTRPLRNSVEGLNQEIEKLVLYPGQQHTCRPEISLYSHGTPEGHRVSFADLLHDGGGGSVCGGVTRSVNTQTPNREHLSSDDSQSTSPEDCPSSLIGASPRINRFLSCAPNDCAKKVCLKLNDPTHNETTVFKPCVGFKWKPSLGSAFQPLQPNILSSVSLDRESNFRTAMNDDNNDGGAGEGDINNTGIHTGQIARDRVYVNTNKD